MSRNTLEQGKPRIGWMIDGDPQTPEVAVMLELTEDAIHLTIPTKGMFGPDDPYARWFSNGTHYGDDPDKTKYRYSPPKNLLFYDHLGPVVLVGCWAGASSSSSNGAGFGRVSAEYAAVGQHDRNLDQINGIRAEMPALNAWTGISSRSSKVTFDAKQRTRILTVEMSSPATTRLSRTKNFTLAPTWRTSAPESDTHATHDVVQLVTETRRGDDWEAHLAPHRAVQDLISLSAWRQLGFSRIEVGKMEPVHPRRREAVGASEEIRWSELITHRLRKHTPWKTDPRFLFRYDDIGAAGVARWLRLRVKYERAMLPLASVIGQHGMFVEAAVLQTGIAVEALGYQLASEAVPSGLNTRGQISYNDAMDRVVSELSFVPVADVEVWKSRSRRSYMGVKHADQPTPDMLTLANAYRENALVLRYWIAGRLGCKASTLEARLAGDPLGFEYEPVS
ncbi:hypothetical protein [Microbacterium sp. NPDC089695]|uniref:ApeA N-terminal domain 1-containing protein n=1 Tax=Microbacterium sp. NPDC089695 TaxID=3364198 RepID=UPI00382C6126